MSSSPLVLFQTLWAEPADGWSIACRGYARAMHSAGLDVRLHSWAPFTYPLDEQVLAEVQDFISKPTRRQGPKWDCFIFSSTLGGPELLDPSLKSLLEYQSPRMFYTTFERSKIASSTAELLKQLDGVWVPCTRNAEVLREAGVENVVVIPHCYFDDDPLLSLPAPRGLPEVFTWIGRWEPRKAPDNLVLAFLLAFSPGEARLILKLSPLKWGDDEYPTFTQVVRKALQNPGISSKWSCVEIFGAITLIDDRLSRQEMIELHGHTDVYVSASRGEGWDLPSFEAKLAGRRVVTTDSGGPRDFLGPDDILVPATGTVLADPKYNWGEGASYNDYDLRMLAKALRQAYEDPKPGSRESVQHCHYKQVGLQLRSWIEGLLL